MLVKTLTGILKNMVKISTIFGLGLLIAVMQFLGFSADVKNYFYILSGLLVTVLSVLIRRELHEVIKHLHDINMDLKSDTFTESSPNKQKEINN